MSSTSLIEIFCCYARKDQPLMQSLKNHLMPLQRQGLIAIWSDTDIHAGTDWEQEIKQHLNTAQIILLLVSPDFIASEYCYSTEMTVAMERHERNEVCVVPIILRPTHWETAPFGRIQALPKDAKPITKWIDEDDALYDVAERIGNVVKEQRIQRFLKDTQQLYYDEHYAEALIIYDQLIDLAPDYAPAYLGKGKTLLALKKYEECLISFDRASELDTMLAESSFYEYKAEALANLRRVEESLAAYDAAIRLRDDSAQKAFLYEKKANLLTSLQRYTEALEVYQNAIKLTPEKISLYEHAGDIQRILDQPQLALEMYQRAIDLDSRRGSSHILLLYPKEGQLLFQLKRFEDALKIYEAVISADPFEGLYCLQKGRCLLELQKYKEALATFEANISIWEKDLDPYFYHGKGKALLGLQQYEEALRAFDQAITLMDSHVDSDFYRDKGLTYERLAKQTYELAEQAQADQTNLKKGLHVEPSTIPVEQAAIMEKHVGGKQPRLPRGQRTPETAYYQSILQALVDVGGSAKPSELFPRIEQYMKPRLKPVDYDTLASDPGEQRWVNTIRFARKDLVKKGLLKPKNDSSFGIWEISEEGRKFLYNHNGK